MIRLIGESNTRLRVASAESYKEMANNNDIGV